MFGHVPTDFAIVHRKIKSRKKRRAKQEGLGAGRLTVNVLNQSRYTFLVFRPRMLNLKMYSLHLCLLKTFPLFFINGQFWLDSLDTEGARRLKTQNVGTERTFPDVFSGSSTERTDDSKRYFWARFHIICMQASY